MRSAQPPRFGTPMMVRVVRKRWVGFLFGGALCVVVGLTLLGGLAQALVVFLGIGVALFALVRAAGDTDYRREPPVPPGTHGPPTSGF